MHQHYQPEFRFCPVCGGKLETRLIKEGEPNRLICTECRFIFYLDPKVVACTIVEVDNGIVLLKRAIDPQKGKWVMPGGYVDRGEVVETAAIRETKEECGMSIEIDSLLGVYSYPGRLAVVIVYTGKCIDGTLSAGDETTEAKVFDLDHIPWDKLAFQSTTDAIKDYIKIKTG